MLDKDKYSISPLIEKPVSQDYEKLRELGISHIQSFSSQLWTDFNIHDPGVTILELLCYAITDLGYRTNFDIKDILTQPGETGPEYANTFYSAKEILTCHPVTINDYRKIFLDSIPEIKNIWLIPIVDKVYKPEIYIANDFSSLVLNPKFGKNPISLNGLYLIKYELYEDERYIDYLEKQKLNTENDLILKKEFVPVDERSKLLISKKIQACYLAHRDLCEDIQCVNTVEYEYVGICADIELAKEADPVQVKKDIYKAINEYISPQLNFYTIEQLLNKGKTIEDIFQGSAANSGFIDYDELEKFQKRDVLYTSDVINLLMDNTSIASIRKLHFSSYKLDPKTKQLNIKEPLKDSEEYCLHLSKQESSFKFRLDILEHSESRINKIKFFYDSLNISVTLNEGDVKLSEVAPVTQRPFDPSIGVSEFTDLPHPSGTYRELEKYYSVQNEFPVTYSIGKEGISDTASDVRKAQRLQLKGYLLFFEQLLTDYLAQLSNVSRQLSFSEVVNKHDYFFQQLSDEEIIDLDKLKKGDHDLLFKEDKEFWKYLSEIVYNKNDADNKIFKRRNRFLNMLIARFNDSFVELSISQFIKKSTNNADSYKPEEIIEDKRSFLRAYPKISGERFHAFNYGIDVCNTNNISGYEFLMLKKLGVSNKYDLDPDLQKGPDPDPNEMISHSLIHPLFRLDPSGHVLASNPPVFFDNRKSRFDFAFGFHIFEHILLRPRWGSSEILLNVCADEFSEDCPCNDPYSFKITAVMPAWLDISMNMNFRRYVEKTMREELPAHISMKICWVSPEQMHNFEKSFFGFTDCLKAFSIEHSCYENLTEPDPVKSLNYYTDSLNNLITVVNDLNNVYPPSYLVDCEGIEIVNNEILKAPIVLGQSALNEYRDNSSQWKPFDEKDSDIFIDIDQLEKERIHFINNGKCGDENLTFKSHSEKAEDEAKKKAENEAKKKLEDVIKKTEVDDKMKKEIKNIDIIKPLTELKKNNKKP